MTLVERLPTGLLRLLLRAPVWLYRAGAGRLLGHRFLYLAHTGRKSGRRRDVVLEVARFDAQAREAFVVAAWGTRSDWFRNITAAPPLEVRIGGERWAQPGHRVLDAAETEVLLRGYSRAHPRAWRALGPRLGLADGFTPEGIADAAARFPAVAFRP